MKRRNLLKGFGAAAFLSPTVSHSSMDKLMNIISEDKLETAKTVIQNATRNGKLKIALGMVGNQDGPVMMDSSGINEPQSKVPIRPDTIFSIIASMTKLVTTIAALQLVESGKIELDAPVNTYLPEMDGLKVLLGFDNAGDPLFEDAVRAPTARELITHLRLCLPAGMKTLLWPKRRGWYLAFLVGAQSGCKHLSLFNLAPNGNME